jgi:hypothetical protein
MYNTVIIIPYRNRKAQLDHFIAKTAPLIEKYMPNTIILVVEQFSDDKLFNRGYLLNVGFKEYENNTKYFIMHDVDINPTQLFIESHYNSDINDETALCLYTSTSNTFGGIVKITENTIKKINGFPNDIWGWGTEDKALQNRGEFYNIKKNVIFYVNSAEENNDYLTRVDNVQDRVLINQHDNMIKHYHLYKNLNQQQKQEYIYLSGLNTMNYEIIETIDLHKIVKLIKVKIT